MLLCTCEGDWCFDDVGRAVQLVGGGASVSLQYVVVSQLSLWCWSEDLFEYLGVGSWFELRDPV